MDPTFATTADTPAPGLSLYRFSVGHGGLQCEACHGSTHAEFPSSHRNDNLRNLQLQGHVGVMVECTACHATLPVTVTGGPHGMHPVGQAWVNQHGGLFDGSGQTAQSQCQACHGTDYRGTILSRAQGDRQFAGGSDNFTLTVQLFRGAQIGCYTCHNGPGGQDVNTSPAPTVSNVSASTAIGQAVTFTLPASGATLALSIIAQPANGSVGLAGNAATFFPAPGFAGTATFTFAAYDGAKNSNLGTATVTVGSLADTIPPTVKITSPTSGATYTAAAATLTLAGTAADNVGVVSVTWTNSRGGSGTATGTTNWTAPGIPLSSGLNVLTVMARDAANLVGTDTLTVTSGTSNRLTVISSGVGTVAPNLNGQALLVGKTYSLTARPGSGYLFAAWSGSLSVSTPTIQFVMQPNLVLQANFIRKPAYPAGIYNALFSESDGPAAYSCGSLTLTLSTGGGASAKLQLAGASYPFSSQFDAIGKAHALISRATMNPLTVDLQFGHDQRHGSYRRHRRQRHLDR